MDDEEIGMTPLDRFDVVLRKEAHHVIAMVPALHLCATGSDVAAAVAGLEAKKKDLTADLTEAGTFQEVIDRAEQTKFWRGIAQQLDKQAASHDLQPAKKQRLLSDIRVLADRWRPFVREASRLFVAPDTASQQSTAGDAATKP